MHLDELPHLDQSLIRHRSRAIELCAGPDQGIQEAAQAVLATIGGRPGAAAGVVGDPQDKRLEVLGLLYGYALPRPQCQRQARQEPQELLHGYRKRPAPWCLEGECHLRVDRLPPEAHKVVPLPRRDAHHSPRPCLDELAIQGEGTIEPGVNDHMVEVVPVEPECLGLADWPILPYCGVVDAGVEAIIVVVDDAGLGREVGPLGTDISEHKRRRPQVS